VATEKMNRIMLIELINNSEAVKVQSSHATASSS
jgi:hypothetical protein